MTANDNTPPAAAAGSAKEGPGLPDLRQAA